MRIDGKVDGSGTLAELEFTEEGQALVQAEQTSRIAHRSGKHKDAFMIGSGFVAYTAAAGALFYMKNTHESKDVHIQQIRTCFAVTSTTAAANNVKYELFKNPGSSDGGVSVVPVNLNFGSNSELTGTFTTGVNGKVFGNTDTLMGTWINHAPGHSVDDYQGSLIVSPGSDFGIRCTPSAAGVSCITMLAFYGE